MSNSTPLRCFLIACSALAGYQALSAQPGREESHEREDRIRLLGPGREYSYCGQWNVYGNAQAFFQPKNQVQVDKIGGTQRPEENHLFDKPNTTIQANRSPNLKPDEAYKSFYAYNLEHMGGSSVDESASCRQMVDALDEARIVFSWSATAYAESKGATTIGQATSLPLWKGIIDVPKGKDWTLDLKISTHLYNLVKREYQCTFDISSKRPVHHDVILSETGTPPDSLSAKFSGGERGDAELHCATSPSKWQAFIGEGTKNSDTHTDTLTLDFTFKQVP